MNNAAFNNFCKIRKMIYRNIVYTSLFVIIFANTLSAQSDLSLSDALSKGLENNFDIKVMKKKQDVASLNNNWGALGRYPNVNFSLRNANSYNNVPKFTNPDLRDKYLTQTLTPGVNLRWTIFNGFYANINKAKLNDLEKLSAGNVALMVENAIQGIILGYYKALLEEEKLKIVAKVMKLSRDRFNYMETKKNLGSAVTYDVLQAQNAYLNDSTNYLMQVLNVENAKRNLNLLLGEAAEVEYNLTDEFKAELYTYSPDSLKKKMFANNRTLLNQYINLDMLNKNIRLAKSALYPSLSLSSGYDRTGIRSKYENQDATTSNSFKYYANFTLSWTLFNGGNTRRAIQASAIQKEIGKLEIDKMKLSLSNVLFNTYNLYNIRKQIYAVALETIESAKLNLDISNEKYKNGTINSFNYRDVQLLYLNAAFNKLQTIFRLIDTHTELLRLTGGIVSE